ncbi:hypothetical protein LIER_34162 [Lithospermum erythrorhizon]|uniref:Uncharacterized protein n=1 Tax=Lithospermum erythrorhizon TaxID=34254 RepID=A0AAV3S2A7_LITER
MSRNDSRRKGQLGHRSPTVLWFFLTTPNPIIRETPFSLVYGSDALLPVEIRLETAWVSYYYDLANVQGLRLNLDLLEEKRAAAVEKIVRYKSKVAARVMAQPGLHALRTKSPTRNCLPRTFF